MNLHKYLQKINKEIEYLETEIDLLKSAIDDLANNDMGNMVDIRKDMMYKLDTIKKYETKVEELYFKKFLLEK